MKKLSDINRCNLEAFPFKTKKEYSGLAGNWIYSLDYFPIDDIKYEIWEFGWKQKALKESYNVDYYNYKIYEYKEYLIYDYNSCFIIFNIMVVSQNNKINRCELLLHSTDDGDFYIDFDYKHIDKVKHYFKKNYKILTLDLITEFIKNL